MSRFVVGRLFSDNDQRHPRLASFLVPPLALFALLYQSFAGLQVAVAQPESLLVLGAVLFIGVAVGWFAAFGPVWVRIGILALTSVILLDVALQPSRVLDALSPSIRSPSLRDETRLADLRAIQAGLEAYIRDVGPLPRPAEYGEETGPRDFWHGWWDVSAVDGDGDGNYFLDFLVSYKGSQSVPLDPINRTADPQDPRSGTQYVYFVVPPGNNYEGGVCAEWQGKWVYMLAITDLQAQSERRPEQPSGSGCPCLWRDKPDYFQDHFDYVICGTFAR